MSLAGRGWTSAEMSSKNASLYFLSVPIPCITRIYDPLNPKGECFQKNLFYFSLKIIRNYHYTLYVRRGEGRGYWSPPGPNPCPLIVPRSWPPEPTPCPLIVLPPQYIDIYIINQEIYIIRSLLYCTNIFNSRKHNINIYSRRFNVAWVLRF